MHLENHLAKIGFLIALMPLFLTYIAALPLAPHLYVACASSVTLHYSNNNCMGTGSSVNDLLSRFLNKFFISRCQWRNGQL